MKVERNIRNDYPDHGMKPRWLTLLKGSTRMVEPA
jgi:hypothetical protein